MKRYLLIGGFAGLVITSSFSQVITGKIIDSDTREAVESVYVKNKNQYEHIAFSKGDGGFSIYADANDTIEFYRIGYDIKTMLAENVGNIAIELIPKAYALDEVVITFDEAYEIYNKAAGNLKDKYLKDAAVYLWHGMESRDDRKNESYAMYSAKFDPDKSKFDLRLIALNHQAAQSKKPVSGLPFHGIMGQLKKEVERKIIKVNSEDDSLIFLRELFYAKKLKATIPIDIVINRADTVLLYVRMLTGNLVKNLKIIGIETGNVAIINDTIKISYNRKNSYYCLDELYFKAVCSMEYKNSNPKEILRVEYSTKFLHIDEPSNNGELKKLTGRTNQLYKLKPTTTENLWKQYIK
jgi:hypothetical protein